MHTDTANSSECILYTMSEVAALFGVSQNWLRSQIRAGTGPKVLKVAGAYRYPKLDALKWLANQRVKEVKTSNV